MTKIKANTNAFGQIVSLNPLDNPKTNYVNSSSEGDVENYIDIIKKSQNIASNLLSDILSQHILGITYDGYLSMTLQSSYSIIDYSTKLYFPPVYDFTNTSNGDIYFQNTKHSFYYGYPVDIGNPTFGTNNSSFLIGVIKFKRGNKLNLNIHNETKYDINMHWHGLNVNPYNDGASCQNIFGPDTKIGPIFNFDVNNFTNNGCIMWVHPHPMFQTLYYIYLGLVGLVLMEDEICKHIDDYFTYGDNFIPIIPADINYNDNGTINIDELYGFRLGDYSIINGTSCISWNPENKNKKYINKLYHESSSNLIKLTFLNGTFSFRFYCIGICDKYDNIKYFTQIGTDQGYRDPLLLDNVFIGPGERISILFDLNDFIDNEAYLFFYSVNAQVGNSLPIISHETKNFITKLKYLKINYSANHNPLDDYDLIFVLNEIQKLVFGPNYETFINLPLIEKLDYGKYLNPYYFYNLPDFIQGNIQSRNILFMLDLPAGTKGNGSTEYIQSSDSGQDKVWSDMWTDFEYQMYLETHNNYFLPTCLFSILQYSGDYLDYSNYRDMSNHKMIINIYKDETLSNIYKTVSLNFSETDKPLNIREWMDFVHFYFSTNYFLDDDDKKIFINDIIDYYWEPYVFKYTFNIYTQIYTVKMFIKNKTNYYVELKGRWPLLMFFGKPFGATMAAMNNSTYSCHSNCDDNKMNMNDIPSMEAIAGDRDGNQIEADKDDLFSLVIYPTELYCGFCDGFNNDNFKVFSVKNNFTEKWIFNNDSTDFHPIHFHNTSSYAQITGNNYYYNITDLQRLAYSKDTYSLNLGSKLELRLKFPYNASTDGKIKYLGYMIHCHFMDHHDMNMMNQFFVYNDKSEFFN
jgi:FtsP/CotA-like multicopper oxidase with cupredoxin domain